MTKAIRELYPGDFQARLWKDLAKRLRRAVPQICRIGKVVQAAMLLAFAGAIEQNLCEFPAPPLDLMRQGALINPDPLIEYLREVLN